MPPKNSLGATQGLPECYLCATSCCQSATKVLPKCYLRASCVLPMRYLSAPYVLPAAIPKGHTLNRSNLAVRRRLWAPRRRRLRRQSAGGCLLAVRVPSVQHQCYSSVPRNATECCRIRKCYHAQPRAAYAQPMCPRSTEMPTLVLPKCCLTCPLHVLGLSALPKCHLCAAATLPNCNHKQSVPNALPNASTPLCFRIDSDGYRSATSWNAFTWNAFTTLSDAPKVRPQQ